MMEQKLRPRRMRISENMRAMVRETQLSDFCSSRY